VKRAQLESYHKASSEEMKATIELDPVVVFHQALENGEPLLIITKVVKSGQTYMV
jgi:small subunit ribosomal protein S7